MATRKGQKYQNTFKFQHNPNSKKTSQIKAIPIEGLCRHCSDILQWKKDYRKYQTMNAPKQCISCLQKTVNRAYHIICQGCATKKKICAKCQQPRNIIRDYDLIEKEKAAEKATEEMVKEMTERERRTYYRNLDKPKSKQNNSHQKDEDQESYDLEDDDQEDDDQEGDDQEGDDQEGDNQVGDDQEGDNQVGDNQVGDDQVGDNQVGDNQVGDDQEGDDQEGDDQEGDDQEGDDQDDDQEGDDQEDDDLGDDQEGDDQEENQGLNQEESYEEGSLSEDEETERVNQILASALKKIRMKNPN